mgnify:CR=1 FL=1|tara:strand:- start:755 stop:3559 length:2805 start_codon:yes stop_codon:yes gene_type:complete
MKQLSFLFILLFTSICFSQSVLSGKIIDGEFNEPLPFANIVLEQSDGTYIDGTTSDFDGLYKFYVSPGNYRIQISFVGYETNIITDINIGDNEEVSANATLLSAANSLEEVIVTTSARTNSEAAVLSIQKKAVNLLDGLSSQAIKKTGDSDLASAIKRVPGVSVQDGKFVYVRGLGDRYSKTLLGGMEVPGLDPDKNTLQLDIFPTNLLDNIIINKSASADLAADFTGGIVDVVLKDFSLLPEYSFSISGSYNPDMNLNSNFIGNEKDAFDVFGFGNSYFDLPINPTQEIPFPGFGSDTDNQVINITNRFEKTMSISRFDSFLDYSIGATASNQFEISNGKSLGYIAAVGFKRDYEYYEDFYNATYEKQYLDQPLNPFNQQQGELGQVKNLASGLLGLSYKTSRSKYKLNVLAIKASESVGIKAIYEDFIENPYIGPADILTYTDRSIVAFPFSSLHTFSDGKKSLEIKISPSIAKVYDKDFKKTVFNDQGNGRFLITPSAIQDPTRLWRNLEEKSLSSSVKLSIDFDGKIQGKLKLGAASTIKNRDYSTSNYIITIDGSSAKYEGDPNNLLNNNFIWDPSTRNGSYIKGSFQRTNQFDATNETLAGFISGELKLSEKWKSTLGLRIENYKILYTGEDLEQVQFNDKEFINTSDLYPSVNIIRSVNEDRNLRFSFSKTTARPSFKELSAAYIFDPISERFFLGNIDLKPTYINNFDLRYESFGSGNQIFAISLFYKTFDNPIELTVYDPTSPTIFIVRNNKEADVLGAELELRKDIINNEISKLSINLNTSVIDSKQTMSDAEFTGRLASNPDKEITNIRELQGQSPYLINIGITYNQFEKNTEFGAYYNVQGKTLEVVGVGKLPDVYTYPFHNLNFNISKNFGKNLNQSINLQAKNVLNESRESKYDYYGLETAPFSIYKPGVSYSIGYSIKF